MVAKEDDPASYWDGGELLNFGGVSSNPNLAFSLRGFLYYQLRPFAGHLVWKMAAHLLSTKHPPPTLR